MKKYLIIAVCLLTLISCDDTLYKVPPGDTTLSEVEIISADTNYYKILITDNDYINIYSSDNKLVYKDCSSSYKNDLTPVYIGFIFAFLFICIICVFLLATILTP